MFYIRIVKGIGLLCKLDNDFLLFYGVYVRYFYMIVLMKFFIYIIY